MQRWCSDSSMSLPSLAKVKTIHLIYEPQNLVLITQPPIETNITGLVETGAPATEECCGGSLAIHIIMKFYETRTSREEWKLVSSFWAKRDSRRECHKNSSTMYRTKKEWRF